MKYSELLQYRKEYLDRENAWLENLVTGAHDFRVALQAELAVDDSYTDDNGRQQHYMRLLEPSSEQNRAPALPYAADIKTTDDGELPFVLELRLVSENDVYPVWIYLGVRLTFNGLNFALWDVPSTFQAKSKNWRSLAGIVREVCIELEKYMQHDPITGNRSGISIV